MAIRGTFGKRRLPNGWLLVFGIELTDETRYALVRVSATDWRLYCQRKGVAVKDAEEIARVNSKTKAKKMVKLGLEKLGIGIELEPKQEGDETLAFGISDSGEHAHFRVRHIRTEAVE